jgi:hypothetical protein
MRCNPVAISPAPRLETRDGRQEENDRHQTRYDNGNEIAAPKMPSPDHSLQAQIVHVFITMYGPRSCGCFPKTDTIDNHKLKLNQKPPGSSAAERS